MKYSEIKDKSVDELKELLGQLKKENMNLRFQRTIGELEKTNRFKEIRKDIARTLTCLNSHDKTGVL